MISSSGGAGLSLDKFRCGTELSMENVRRVDKSVDATGRDLGGMLGGRGLVGGIGRREENWGKEGAEPEVMWWLVHTARIGFVPFPHRRVAEESLFRGVLSAGSSSFTRHLGAFVGGYGAPLLRLSAVGGGCCGKLLGSARSGVLWGLICGQVAGLPRGMAHLMVS